MDSRDLIPHLDQCDSCRAAIVWAVTDNDRLMPVNPKPADQGNVLLAEVGGGLHATPLTRGQQAGARERDVPLYLSHFADCPDAKRHRRTR